MLSLSLHTFFLFRNYWSTIARLDSDMTISVWLLFLSLFLLITSSHKINSRFDHYQDDSRTRECKNKSWQPQMNVFSFSPSICLFHVLFFTSLYFQLNFKSIPVYLLSLVLSTQILINSLSLFIRWRQLPHHPTLSSSSSSAIIIAWFLSSFIHSCPADNECHGMREKEMKTRPRDKKR